MKVVRKVIVSHVGARDEYIIARLFASMGILHNIFTDYWFKPLFKIFPNFLKKKFIRRSNSVVESFVKSYSIIQILRDIFFMKTIKNYYNLHLLLDKNFSNFVKENIKNENFDLHWGFSNCHLEILEFCSNKKILTVHNQLDPGIEYIDIKREINAMYPNVERSDVLPNQLLLERKIKEWSLADYIVVNSKYSKICLEKHGVDGNKIMVLPLVYNNKISTRKKTNYDNKLNIGFAGTVSLMKGILTFIDVAQELNSEMNFKVAGKVQINDWVIKENNSKIKFLGHLNRNEINDFYNSIDVLIFPTLCDGFGMVQLEALSYGVPVISTDFCADIVSNNVDGYKANSSEEIIEILKKIDKDRNLLNQLSINAQHKANQYTEENLKKSIIEEFLKKGIKFNTNEYF